MNSEKDSTPTPAFHIRKCPCAYGCDSIVTDDETCAACQSGSHKLCCMDVLRERAERELRMRQIADENECARIKKLFGYQ